MTALGTGLGSALAPLGIPGSRSFDPTYRGDIVEAASLAETLDVIIGYSEELTDTASFIALMDAVRAQLPVLSVTVGIAQTGVVSYGPVIVDLLRIDPAIIANSITSHVFADEVGVEPSLAVALPIALAQTIGLAPVASAQLALSIADELGVLPALAVAATYHLTMTQAVTFGDSLAQFFGVAAADTLGLAETLALARSTYNTVAETVGVSVALTPLFLVRVDLEDEVALEPEEVLNMIYRPVLAEEIEITGAYLAPDGSFTTWALNTRTGAVTEYDNFEFNSFAQVGARYFGASTDGLYELHGDDDEGVDIVARIKSGLLQFGGTHLSRLKAAYLGVRGEGDWVLRIETGHGESYDYAVSTRDMRSTKVHMGKGQRARYFSFELISEGQDFDLDTIEFVPIVVQRRV